ncbi:DIP1984 family protein [Deinococcus aquiradiocola]|uniref:Septicolysin n=1 Tax=Deinococcus aquiradiocola TaxID=393059 RepID=A0A917PP98_9DEIO|nr:DIP1984 family protein [Deinococcus aquiradiocola]GGJ86268.1 hypothetical protein GCM10008939_32720 [Deinococcus aquiradiocola]
MPLAEALIERADLQKRALQLQARLHTNAKTQEGETPAEDPAELLTELMGLYDRLDTLIARIHRSNMAARLPDGRTLTDALAHREVLDLRLTALRGVTEAASIQQTRQTRSELRYVSHLPVRDLQAQTDRLARERRKLETLIQQTNWQSPLLD